MLTARPKYSNYKGNGLCALDYNGNGAWDGSSIDRIYSFGSSIDQPVVGDWNGDGKDEIGNYKGNGVWALDYNGNGAWDGTTIDRVYSFGAPAGQPVVGDWNADGKDEIGIYSNGTWYPGLLQQWCMGWPDHRSVKQLRIFSR